MIHFSSLHTVPQQRQTMACNGMTSSFFPPSFMRQMQNQHEEEHQLSTADVHGLLPASAATAPCTNIQDFRSDQMAHICMAPMMGKRSMSFSAIERCEEMNGEDDLSDDGSQAGEKKRRLNVEQVRTLEKNFELGNKLEPERKMQLARALGLQPRQVAIWFQNRRARWKTKQLEKDYDVLKKQFKAVKLENEALQSENKKLQSEILALKGRETSEPINLNKETEASCSNRSENSSEINLDISRAPALDSPLHHPHHHQNIPFFQPLKPADIDQLFHSTSRPEAIQCLKVENGVPEGQFGNLLCSIEDQSAFWSWSDHHNFH